VFPNVRLVHISDGEARQASKQEVLERVPIFVDGVHEFVLRTSQVYDIIHCHHYHAGEACIQLQQRGGPWESLPVVVMYHSIGSLECPDEDRKEIEKKIGEYAKCVIATTEQDREDIIHHCGCIPEKLYVIPCGVDLFNFRPRDQAEVRTQLNLPPAPQPIGLFVGRIDPVKNISGIISATSILKRKCAGYDSMHFLLLTLA
jgi:glycosyltransferase involved in cell wall biosynthesis